ncbi:hypothetical protein [Novosphingobium sp. 9U]|uniref:hypothetical protein n=1 Tax=Novosphingobium sp. 9U TaxID=2653158 RepID=UPI0012F02CF7|nr:hypothetical protein [Novosphingobium sp. 9U]VWX51757.1 conserved hypothetical protein [Novosphingobium sp. 9U]
MNRKDRRALAKAQFLAVKPRVITVPHPLGEGTISLRQLTLRTRLDMQDALYANITAVDAYEADQELPQDEREGIDPVKRFDHTLLTILFSIADLDGELMFTITDYDALEQLPHPMIEYLWREVVGLNTLKSAVEDREHVEELKKSSD